MDCSELMKLFNVVGGTLVCDYTKGNMNVEHTNLECNIKPKDYEGTVYLMHDFGMSPYNVKTIKETNKEKINKSDIRNINRYLDNDEKGYIVRYLNS